jgi:NAD(P)-dependent dehydrogenase (short-subunit alcohol dehydrogenase family)
MSIRRALVTGGSRGIGAAVAAALAGSGHAVAVHYRTSRERAHAVLAGLPGAGHAAVAGDLTDPAQARGVVTAAVQALGGVDVLVNNAGTHREQPITTGSYADWQESWQQVLQLNVAGTANVTWAVVEHLRGRPEGAAGARVIMVGSRGAYRGSPLAPAYVASKAAVHSLAQSLAVALGPDGIGVAAVAPGFVRTEMVESVLAGPRGDAIRAQSPYGRVAEPAEIAAAISWLASPEAQWASGAVLDLNGASYLH